MSNEYRLILSVLLIAGMIYAAHRLDMNWRKKNPDHRPFKWGYFQALFFFPLCPLATIGWIVAAPLVGYSLPIGALIFYLWLSFVGGYAGFMLITKKSRWAWLFVVIAQLNLINMAINYYYGSKRWGEFTKFQSNQTAGDNSGQRDAPTSASHP